MTRSTILTLVVLGIAVTFTALLLGLSRLWRTDWPRHRTESIEVPPMDELARRRLLAHSNSITSHRN